MTPIGRTVKRFFNRNRRLGVVPGSVLTLWDFMLNNRARLGYAEREYPIVRAQVSLAARLLERCGCAPAGCRPPDEHLTWLERHALRQAHGIGWGLGFHYEVAPDYHYSEDTALSTMTADPLEAFCAADDQRWSGTIRQVRSFFLNDLAEMPVPGPGTALSYATFPDRIVFNSNVYSSYALALSTRHLGDPAGREGGQALDLANRIMDFVLSCQRADGGWTYRLESPSFVDGYHTCFQLRLMFRLAHLLQREDIRAAVDRGVAFVNRALVATGGLCRRFAEADKPVPVRWDLYDSAELLALQAELGDIASASKTAAAIASTFIGSDGTLYSVVDRLGVRRNGGMLRWALVPLLRALSEELDRRTQPLPWWRRVTGSPSSRGG